MRAKRAVGGLILSGLGCCSNLETWVNSVHYFSNKKRLNEILRELKDYKFEKNNFMHRKVWLPKYFELLRRSENL